MDQLITLLWLKWKLALSQLQTPGALLGQVLLWGFGVLVLMLSVLTAVGIFLTLSMLSVGGMSRISGMTLSAMILLYASSFFVVWLMAAVVPARAGGEFDTGHLLHYPFPLARLFWLDVVTEVFKGLSLLLIPPMVSLWLTLPWLYHRLWWGVPPLLLCVLLGALVIRTLELLFGLAGGRGRTSAENAATLGGLVMVGLILAGSLLGVQFVRLVEQDRGWAGLLARALPNALVLEILVSVKAGDVGRYVRALGAFAVYPAVLLPLAWRLWLLKTVGRSTRGERGVGGRFARPWRLPFGSEQLSALVEKEVKYLLRNSQVKALLALGMLILLFKLGMRMPELARAGEQERWVKELLEDLQWMRGLDWLIMMVYATLFFFGLYSNAYGLEEHGFKQYLFSPVKARRVVWAKQLSLTGLMGLLWGMLWVGNLVAFGDWSWEAISVSMGLLWTIVVWMGGIGGLVSIWLPRRGVYGAKLTTSPWAALVLIVELPLVFGPAVLGFYGAKLFELLWIKHGVIWGWVGVSCWVYWKVLLPMSVRYFESRREQLLHVLTTGDDT